MSACGAFYDGLYAKGYRQKSGAVDMARMEALRHFIVSVVRPRSAERVLDYGCGSGINLPLWKDVFPHAEIHSCDISRTAIDQFRLLYPEHADHGAVMAEGRAPYAEASFDVVVSVEVMEHVEDLKAYLADIARVLVAGGIFIWTTPSSNVLSIEHLYARLTGAVLPTSDGFRRWRFEDPTHRRRLKTGEAAAILENAGFNRIRFRHRAHLFSFLCSRCLPGRLGRLNRMLLPLDYTLFRRLPNGAAMIGAAYKV